MYLKDLLNDYYKNKFQYEEDKINSYKYFDSIEGLIARACHGQLGEYRKDSHKYRISKKSKNEVAKNLILSIERLDKCNNFKDILDWVYDCKVKGFNSLSVYDTACAIASHRNLYPEEVYLHTGALEGAINLFGKLFFAKHAKYFRNDAEYPYLEIESFPEVLICLSPFHIENFLCHYRNKLIRCRFDLS